MTARAGERYARELVERRNDRRRLAARLEVLTDRSLLTWGLFGLTLLSIPAGTLPPGTPNWAGWQLVPKPSGLLVHMHVCDVVREPLCTTR